MPIESVFGVEIPNGCSQTSHRNRLVFFFKFLLLKLRKLHESIHIW